MFEQHEHKHDNHCHHDEHEIATDVQVCHQCGKVHSVFFIKEHHCLEETLSTKLIILLEQTHKNFFSTRAPPYPVN
jgi:hypothetical protein